MYCQFAENSNRGVPQHSVGGLYRVCIEGFVFLVFFLSYSKLCHITASNPDCQFVCLSKLWLKLISDLLEKMGVGFIMFVTGI
jgi:hypothetical protein